jgi:hypothetical protein
MMQRLPAPDFLRPVRRPGGLAWALCGIGVLVLGMGALDAHQAWEALSKTKLSASARLVRGADVSAARILPTSRSVPGSPAPAPATATNAQAASAKQDENLQRQLQHPWAEVWASSEAAARAGVVLLRFEHDSAGRLQLQGTAPDATSAQRAAQALRNAPLWGDVLLSRLERADNAQRFEISASLRASGGR